MNKQKNSEDNKEKEFKDLLEDLFQFDSSDLDFGIYRILNYKRKEIEDFIQNRLRNIVEEAFRKHKSSITENIDKEFEQVKQDVNRFTAKNTRDFFIT